MEESMQIDWNSTINDILGNRVACLRCGSLTNEAVVGFSRLPEAAAWSPRKHECARKDECDARKMVVVCDDCARELRLRARKVDEEGMMVMILDECRRELEDALDYLADYWMEDLDIDPDDMDKRLEDIDADVFRDETETRRRLEDEYLSLHRWFREHNKRIPDPGWRGEYVEQIIELGYTTLLGD
jgi:hypothetical protein